MYTLNVYVIISPCLTTSGSLECSYVAVYSNSPFLSNVPLIKVSVFILGVLSSNSTSSPLRFIDEIYFLKAKSNTLSGSTVTFSKSSSSCSPGVYPSTSAPGSCLSSSYTFACVFSGCERRLSYQQRHRKSS